MILIKLFLLFILVPLAEFALLYMIAEATSLLFSIVLVVVTGIVGGFLARRQGVQVLTRLRTELAEGRPPTDAILDAALILIAGAFLLTPGVLTDLFGMSMLIPLCRKFYRAQLVAWFKRNFKIATVFPTSAKPKNEDGVIDSYVVDSPKSKPSE